jgi:hypothetical protein
MTRYATAEVLGGLDPEYARTLELLGALDTGRGVTSGVIRNALLAEHEVSRHRMGLILVGLRQMGYTEHVGRRTPARWALAETARERFAKAGEERA